METKKSYLFVYGTLRSEVSSPVSSLIAEDIKWMGEATINGNLFDIGEYPGAVPTNEANAIVKGELMEILKPARVWPILDEYEGCDQKDNIAPEYFRRKEPVKLSGGKIFEAWIYWYNLPVTHKRRIRSNDYLKYLRKKQLA